MPSENNAINSTTSSAAYSAASIGVRAVPFVNGTRFGHGGSRMVLGRNQYRIDPNGGKNLLLSGPKPHPSPTTSNSMVYSTTFWKTIGSVHHCPTSVKPSMPLVASANSQPPRMYSKILKT